MTKLEAFQTETLCFRLLYSLCALCVKSDVNLKDEEKYSQPFCKWAKKKKYHPNDTQYRIYNPSPYEMQRSTYTTIICLALIFASILFVNLSFVASFHSWHGLFFSNYYGPCIVLFLCHRGQRRCDIWLDPIGFYCFQSWPVLILSHLVPHAFKS